MNAPEPSEEWLRGLVEELSRTPAGGWPGVVRRFAADAPERLGEILETAALLAAEHARDRTRPPAEAAGWRAVVGGLAAGYPTHAADIHECAGLLTAVAGDGPPAPPPGDCRLRPGDRLGPFVVTAFVAGGGMGEVYSARQDGLDRTVALKVIRAGTAGPLARARFARERLVLAKLHQSNIVPVYFAGEHEDLQYYAMQYVAGAPLNRVVSVVYQRATTAALTAQTPPLSAVVDSILKAPPAPPAPPRSEPEDATQVATVSGPAWRVPAPTPGPVRLSAGYFRSVAAALAQVAEAIHHGHETGFLHRDIKPSNLILDTRGVCMVIDYGLARAADAAPAPAADDTVEDALTRGGVGTPQYMAPEQFDGKADARSDVWGLGATLYELLTLRPAFPAVRDEEGRWKKIEERVRTKDPEPADRVVRGVPRDLAAVCRVALAKNPADRYQTAGAFAADLRRWLRWEPTAARPGWATLRPLRLWAWRHKGAAAAVVLAAVALVATAAATTAQADRARDAADARAKHEKQDRELADARAAAADTRADQERKAREFAAALADAEELRRRRPFSGWADAVREKLDTARRIRPDVPLADAYAATLTGLDARRVRLFDFPEERSQKITGFSSVAFGPAGRLVCGGLGTTPGMAFDPNPARSPVSATRAGSGPVAYPDADTPLQLIVPTTGRTLVLWDLAANRAVAEFPLPPQPARAESLSTALSADGRRVAASLTSVPDADGKRTGVTVIWDVGAGKAAPVERAKWEAPASALAFSPDGKYLAAGSAGGGVSVRDAVTGAEAMALNGGRMPVLSLAFGRNFRADASGRPAPPGGAPGLLLAAGTASGSVVVWDLGTRETVCTCRGAAYYVNALAFTPDGASLVTAGTGTAVVWDVATGRPVLDLSYQVQGDGYDGYKTGVAVSADGRRVAITGTNQNGGPGRLQVFELEPDRGVAVYRGLVGQCRQTWLSPSAELVAGLSDNWQVAVWERATGRLRRVWDVPLGWTTDNADLAFDEPAGAVYFSAGETACELNLATGARDRAWRFAKGLNDALDVRPGRPPVLVRREPAAPHWQVRCRELLPDGTSRERYAFPADFGGVERATLTAGGKYLLVHGMVVGGVLQSRVYDAETGRHVPFTPPPGVRPLGLIQMSADGTRLSVLVAAGGGSGVTQLRFPEMSVLRMDADFPAGATDDSGAVGISVTPFEGRPGLSVLRAGQRRPVAVFDSGREPVSSRDRITPDGRFASWGRDDGTACVVDLTRALERLATMTGR